ncbi:uncharacterized protein LOC144488404 [Mustelus asterias]
MRERLLGSLDKPLGCDTKLGAMGEPGEILHQKVGRSASENDAPSLSDSEATNSGTAPLIGKSDAVPGSRRKKPAGRADLEAAGAAGGKKGTGGRRRRTDKTEGLDRKGVAHFAVLTEDTRLLLRRRGRRGEGNRAMKKRNTLKNYQEDIDRVFRRGWQLFLKNLSRLKL